MSDIDASAEERDDHPHGESDRRRLLLQAAHLLIPNASEVTDDMGDDVEFSPEERLQALTRVSEYLRAEAKRAAFISSDGPFGDEAHH